MSEKANPEAPNRSSCHHESPMPTELMMAMRGTRGVANAHA